MSGGSLRPMHGHGYLCGSSSLYPRGRESCQKIPVLLFFLALVLPGVALGQPAWRTESVPGVALPGHAIRLVLDTQANAHIAFVDVHNRLGYVRTTGGAWLAPEYPDTAGHGSSALSLALDAQDDPHITYQGTDFYWNLRYASKQLGTWVSNTIGRADYWYNSFSLALDRQDNPHIAFVNGFPKYASRRAGQWTISGMPAGYQDVGLSLALGSLDHPHIATVSGLQYELYYCVNLGEDWSCAPIDAEDYCRSPSICVDRNGNPCVAYYKGDRSLRYASKSGEAWILETILPPPGPVQGDYFPSLALDEQDNPHVSWLRNGVGLGYSWKTNGSWESQVVYAGSGMYVSSLSLDASGSPRIAFADGDTLRYARLTDALEIVSVSSDAPFYQNGVDVAHISVLTRRHAGDGPVTISLDLIPTAGPTFHVGDDAFTVNPGEIHESVFTWPVPDSSYVYECDADVSVNDGSGKRALWHSVVRNLFQAVQIHPHEVVDYMDLVLNCHQLDPTTECLYGIRSVVPVFGIPPAVGTYYQNMCRAQEFWARGDRARGNAAWNAGIMVPFKLALKQLGDTVSPDDPWLETSRALHSAGTGAITCMKASIRGTAGGSGAGLRDDAAGAFVDSLALWMATGIDSTESDIANVFIAGGDSDARIEADGSWTSADTLGLVAALVLPIDELGSISTVTKHVHNFHGSDSSNPHSACSWRVRSRAEQTVSLGILHCRQDSTRTFLRYADFPVHSSTVMTASLSDTQQTFPLLVDFDGDGSPEEIHYPGGIVVDAGEPDAASLRTTFLGNRPNPFSRGTTISFVLAERTRAAVAIYDAGGRMLARPFDRVAEPGRYHVTWNGRSTAGSTLPSGVYFCRFAADSRIIARRMVLLR